MDKDVTQCMGSGDQARINLYPRGSGREYHQVDYRQSSTEHCRDNDVVGFEIVRSKRGRGCKKRGIIISVPIRWYQLRMATDDSAHPNAVACSAKKKISCSSLVKDPVASTMPWHVSRSLVSLNPA